MHTSPSRPRPRVPASLLAVAVASLLAGCAAEPSAGGPTATETRSASPSATTTATVTANGLTTDAVVYWLGDSGTSTWLYPETVQVPDNGTAVRSAVVAMMTQTPADPDLSTPWSEPSEVSVSQDGDAITVDLSQDAFANTNLGSEQAGRAIQQLVWTATQAADTAGPVTILVDGEPYDAWGTVRLGEPMTRSEDARAPIWVDSPAEGEEVAAGSIPISGSANVYEGNVAIEVTDTDGDVVAETFGTAASGVYRDYSATVDLDPGEYTLSAYSPDVSSGEGIPRQFEVTRTFTVV